MRKRSIIAIALACSVAIAALVAWLNRADIVTGYVDDALKQRGVNASYHVDQIGLRTQRLTNVVVGDPAKPDLTAAWVEVTMQYGLSGPIIAAVSADGVRLRGRWTGDKLSFGAVDKLLPADDGTPLELPDIALALSHASAAIDTPWGKLGFGAAGTGHLRDGFTGRLALRAPSLAMAGCSLDATEAMLRVKIERQVPILVGPLGVGRLSCAGGQRRVEDVRLGLDAAVPLSLEGANVRLRMRTGAAQVGDNALASIEGVSELRGRGDGTFGADWTLNGLEPTTVWGGARAMELSGAGVRNAAGAFDGNGTLRFMGLNSGRGYEHRLAAASNAVRGTPIGPIVDRLVGAASALGRGASASSSYRFSRPSDGAARLALGNITIDAGSGAFFQVSRPDAVQWSQDGGVRVALAGRFGGGGLPRGSFDVASRGSSLAALSGGFRVEPMHHGGASLSLAPVRFSSDGGGTRFSTAVVMSGPLADGRVDGLSMPLDGWVMADGAVSISGGCRRVAWQRIAVDQIVLNAGALPLCSASGMSLLLYNNSGLSGNIDSNSIMMTGMAGGSAMAFQANSAQLNLATMGFALNVPDLRIGEGEGATRFAASLLSGARDDTGYGGRLADASGNIGAVPFLFDQANGDWRWQGNELMLGAALQVTDAADEDRFQPLRSDDTRISYRDGAMRVTGSLMEPISHARVADVAIAHDFADASGHARFTLANLAFARGGLQPVMLTTLSLGVAADAVGTVTGSGRVDWSRDGVTSSVGDFATETMDLSAAFGPVQGMSGAIHFSDLIALATPPGQQMRLRSIYPGVEVTDGVLLYQMLPGQRVHIEEGRWPFAGGQLLLRPTTLDFSADVPRFLTFDVQGVDAGLFLSRYEFDNINATGVFDGVLPTKFTADGGRVEGGLLQSRAGGALSYVGELTYSDLGYFANLAFGALKSLQYDNLSIRMNGNIDGEMLTEVRFSGLSQGDNAQNNFITRAFRRLPFIFNININAPFRQLLTSARGLYDPSTLVGQNIEALVRAERDAAAAANAAQPVQPAVRDNRR